MTVLRFDPFQEFDRLSRQMLGSGRGLPSMPMEAYRRGEQFFIHLDLPGVNPDQVQLTVERNVVAVRAERRSLWQGATRCRWMRPPGGLRSPSVPRRQPGRGPAGGQLRPGHLDPDHPGRRAGQARRIQIGTRSQGPQPVETTGGGQGRPPASRAAAQVRRKPAARCLALGPGRAGRGPVERARLVTMLRLWATTPPGMRRRGRAPTWMAGRVARSWCSSSRGHRRAHSVSTVHVLLGLSDALTKQRDLLGWEPPRSHW
jgi:HSP20 family protein